jgi:tetratricopeptide (TPR) repeat protein
MSANCWLRPARPEALAAYQDNLAIRLRLAERDPDNVEVQRSLAINFDKVGDVLVALGKDADALAAYQNGLAPRQKLAASRPGNAEWQRDLSVSYNKIGDVLSEAGRRTGDRRLSEWRYHLPAGRCRPTNALRQRDLADFDRLGDALAAAGKRDDALAAYRKNLTIRRKLAAIEPAMPVAGGLPTQHRPLGGFAASFWRATMPRRSTPPTRRRAGAAHDLALHPRPR